MNLYVADPRHLPLPDERLVDVVEKLREIGLPLLSYAIEAETRAGLREKLSDMELDLEACGFRAYTEKDFARGYPGTLDLVFQAMREGSPR